MEIEVVKEFEFAAAHFLPDYNGECKKMHGHNYLLQLGVKGKVDEKTGMVLDFATLKKVGDGLIIDILDHKLLNVVKDHSFPCEKPTAENMVIWIKNLVTQTGFLPDISFIRLYETPHNYAEWRKR